MKLPFTSSRTSSEPVVLVPNQWNGSVQQYYHFLLGYLAPIHRWITHHPGKRIAVRDCGPMNRWFDVLRPETDIEIMTVGDVLHVLAGDLQPHRVLRGMDFPTEFRALDLRSFATFTRRIAEKRVEATPSPVDVLVTDRASSDDFFASPAAEWPESGSQKRSVPNLTKVVSTWTDLKVHVLDGATCGIYEQILLHGTAKVLVGQHGAGLTNMLWMAPGSAVVEILPPMPDDATDIFGNLARALGLHHFTVTQNSVHSSVKIEELSTAVRAGLITVHSRESSSLGPRTIDR